jgi:FkbM family methyltransferase
MKYINIIFILIYRNVKWFFLLIKSKLNTQGGYLLLEILNGTKIWLNISTAGFDIKESNIFKQLALDRTREPMATKIMMNFIKPGDVILEAGANIGYYTLLEAKILNGKGKIFAVEPEPKNFTLMKKNIALNGYDKMVEAYQIAFGEKEGRLPFYIAKESNLHSFIKPKKDGYRKKFIKTATIDSFIKSKKEKINFIRMDIEGYECKVIKKMGSFLKQSGPLKLFIELHPHLVKTEEMISLLKKLKNNGFEVYKIISRDTFTRNYLGETTVENMKIKNLMNDDKILKDPRALETFFYKK